MGDVEAQVVADTSKRAWPLCDRCGQALEPVSILRGVLDAAYVSRGHLEEGGQHVPGAVAFCASPKWTGVLDLQSRHRCPRAYDKTT